MHILPTIWNEKTIEQSLPRNNRRIKFWIMVNFARWKVATHLFMEDRSPDLWENWQIVCCMQRDR